MSSKKDATKIINKKTLNDNVKIKETIIIKFTHY